MSLTRTVAVISLALLTTALPGEPPVQSDIDQAVDDCQSRNPATHDQIQCIDAGLRAWDRELNRIYQALTLKLTGVEREKLKAAQLAWIKQRDSEFALIDAVYSKLQGSMYQPMHSFSRMRVVRERALMLQKYLELLEEGGEDLKEN